MLPGSPSLQGYNDPSRRRTSTFSTGGFSDQEDTHDLVSLSGQATTVAGPGSCRHQLRELLEHPDTVTYYSLVGLIIGSTVLTIIDTMPEMREYRSLFQALDYFITAAFTVELCLRLYISESAIAFFSSCYNLIDLISVMPGYVELFLLAYSEDNDEIHQAVGSMRTLRMTRVIRLVRVIRIVRLVNVDDHKYLEQMVLLVRVSVEAGQTGFASILMLLGVTTLFAASLIYLCEPPTCEEVISRSMGLEGATFTVNASQLVSLSPSKPHLDFCSEKRDFESILSSWWWAMGTLTTIGYGDVVPATVMGKLVGGVMCIGAGMILAIAVSQFAYHFGERWTREQAKNRVKRNFVGNDVLVQEQEELEELLEYFQDSLQKLVGKVAAVCVEAGNGSTPDALRPMKLSIEGNAAALTSGTCSYLYEVLDEAMLAEARSPSLRPSSAPASPTLGAAPTTPSREARDGASRRSSPSLHPHLPPLAAVGGVEPLRAHEHPQNAGIASGHPRSSDTDSGDFAAVAVGAAGGIGGADGAGGAGGAGGADGAGTADDNSEFQAQDSGRATDDSRMAGGLPSTSPEDIRNQARMAERTDRRLFTSPN
eukprot:TRINITY_DN23479_c0_g3_i1.p1 TRINITY_DN23479_c0_g3~~TRINITY_DN23479_c0_g3_i1.p1  ORF type:complete len:596 (-),score=94.46 TRINITY_DN23479_c0_g3_i1:47-1834(-)